MYAADTLFDPQPDDTSKIWRYMDLAKFLSLLESQSLYFARADTLDDSFEGSYPLTNSSPQSPLLAGVPEGNNDQKSLALASFRRDKLRKNVAVNCWHLNDHESAAMWRLYLKSNEGIAIQSDYRRLKDCLLVCSELIFLGKVKYIDYQSEYFNDYNLVAPFIHKRKSFEHEQEVRAVILKPEMKPDDPAIPGPGLHIPVATTVLIERIYIAPDAPPWFVDLVRLLVKHYGDHYEVVNSDLNKTPLY